MENHNGAVGIAANNTVEEKGPAMVEFMCELDWVPECPDIQPNVILNGSMGVFLVGRNTYISTQSKADCHP